MDRSYDYAAGPSCEFATCDAECFGHHLAVCHYTSGIVPMVCVATPHNLPSLTSPYATPSRGLAFSISMFYLATPYYALGVDVKPISVM